MAFREVQSLDAEQVIRVGEEDGSDNTVETISGYYLGFKEIANSLNPTRKSKIHVFSIEGRNVGVWGTSVMDRKLAAVPAPSNPNTPSEGTAFMTTVTFTGLKPATKKGYRPSKNYNVGFDDENLIKVDAAIESSINTGSDEDDSPTVDASDFIDDVPAVSRASAFAAKPVTKDHAAAITKLLSKSKK